MTYPIVVAPFLKVDGLTLFPFIFVRNSKLKFDKTLMRHEHIHLRQQFELLILPFYICYLLNYLLNLVRFKDHDRAYRNIIFEREAFDHESGRVISCTEGYLRRSGLLLTISPLLKNLKCI